MTKALPCPCAAEDAVKLAEELLGLDPSTTLEEALRQDGELLHVLEHLEALELELAEVNRALDDSHRGVASLAIELDEQAESLRKAGETRTRFLANVSHELRTPLSSILGLGRLLLDRSDGDLSPEQERQVGFLLEAAQDLAGMVNDLLDLARIEAGREVVDPAEVDLAALFAALRGMVGPLVPPGSQVNVVIDEPSGLPPIRTDGAKLAQILRRLLSNALKFTERGEVRLTAEPGPRDSVVFSISDTGIGIEEEDLPWIFEEFSRVDSPIQRRLKGTGLGLPLARKLARLLGGDINVESQPGVGSTFSATIPARFPE